MKAGRSNRNGYTLIELLVVLAIIGSTSLLVIPKIETANNWDARATDRLREITIEARERAMFSQQPHRVTFDLKESRLLLMEVKPSGEVVDTEFRRSLHPCGQVEQVVINGTPSVAAAPSVTVRSNGWMDDTEIYFKGCDSKNLSVRLTAIAGVIDVNFEQQ